MRCSKAARRLLNRTLGISLLGLALVASFAPAAVRQRPFPHFPASCRRADFLLAGRVVRAEFCRNAHSGREPALVVLYGCGGFGGLDHRLAQTYPHAGFATLYIDYFALTPPLGRRGFCGRAVTSQIASVWRTTVLAAVGWLGSRGGVDPLRVGLLGWSLGANVALATASSPGGRQLAALVAYSPDAFPAAPTAASRFPPTIVLLSRRGDRPSLRGARTFVAALAACGVPNELYLYPAGSHYWQGRQSREGFADAVAFLRRHLS